jgi:hypothetical protein
VCVAGGLVRAGAPAVEKKQTAAETIGKYLALGAAGEKLPASFSVSIETQGSPTKESGKTNELFDAWRFTHDSVSQLDAKHQVVATRPFRGIKEMCRTLVNGDLGALADMPRGRVTPILTLLGTPCAGGHESITVTVEGKSLRVDGQSCWTTSFADEKHQERFTQLYRALGKAARAPIASETIRWGTPVNGLQLGIAPPVNKEGDPEATFDGNALRARVFCRNAGEASVRLLASVHTCLLGGGGNNALLASEVTLAPKDGGKAMIQTLSQPEPIW